MKIKRSSLFGALALLLWAPIPWLYFNPPDFLAGQPLAIYAVVLVLAGLSSAAIALLFSLRSRVSERAARVYVFLFVFAFIGAYQLSGLAPNWNCFGKQIYVATANAAGQNCTTTCTNNKKKACSGWSTCWNKFVSCSASGVDQDGRPCKGCCFSCTVVCSPPPPSGSDQPPTITSSINCLQWGGNGWCIGTETLTLTASDPQGYTLTISGDIDGTPYTCAAGSTCSQNLPDGDGLIQYTVTASQSGLTASGSVDWQRDTTPPIVSPVLPSPNGSNGWFITTPVAVSVNGSDSLSGLASAQVSVNGGASQPSASLASDGVYTLNFSAIDNAGNATTTSRTISIDTTPPAFTTATIGTTGNTGWYVSTTTTTVSPSDALSGVDTVEYNLNSAGWQNGTSIASSDGVNTISIRVHDVAGNIASGSVSVSVDTIPPTITPAISGTAGANGWLVSPGTVSAAVSDATSGASGNAEVSFDAGRSWQSMPVALNDGAYNMNFRAFDVAGNAGSASFDAAIDTTNPELSFVFTGTPGMNGWYVSDVDVTSRASDALSGLESNEVRADGGAWAPSKTVSDGVHDLEARASDKGGNTKSISSQLRVDNNPPSSAFTNPINNEVVSGVIALSGRSSDAMSGLQSAEISLDSGATWKTANLSGDTWSFNWDTKSVPNGTYTVLMRGLDMAGNREKPITLTLIADNFPPAVQITDSWWIWESGEFNVSANGFAINEIRITISDPQNRWPPVKLTVNKTSGDITWDRRFPGGIIAPSGNYKVTILVCDIYDNCSSADGKIQIPFIAPVPPAFTPTALVPAPMPTVTSSAPTKVVITKTPVTPAPAQVIEERQPPQKTGVVSNPVWVILILSLLILLFATEALTDPRPRALRSLAQTINQFNTRSK